MRALIEAGAIRKVRIIADGSVFHVEADTPTSTVTATTSGGIKTRSTLDTRTKGNATVSTGRKLPPPLPLQSRSQEHETE